MLLSFFFFIIRFFFLVFWWIRICTSKLRVQASACPCVNVRVCGQTSVGTSTTVFRSCFLFLFFSRLIRALSMPKKKKRQIRVFFFSYEIAIVGKMMPVFFFFFVVLCYSEPTLRVTAGNKKRKRHANYTHRRAWSSGIPLFFFFYLLYLCPSVFFF